jgi:hypothetical protein
MYRRKHDLFHRGAARRSFQSEESTCAEVAPVLDDNTQRMTAQEFRDHLMAHGELDNVMAELDKLGFNVDFVAREVFSGGADVTVSHVAMLWQGMPNKHDRKRTRQLLETLSRVGLLTPKGDDETFTRT